MWSIQQIAGCFQTYQKKLKIDGLSDQHYIYIQKICKFPGIIQDDLAALLYIDKSSVTRQIAQLETAGYVIRKPDERDRRFRHIYPTEKAKKILPAIKQMRRQWNEQLTEDISDADWEALTRILDTLTFKAIELSGQPESIEDIDRKLCPVERIRPKNEGVC